MPCGPELSGARRVPLRPTGRLSSGDPAGGLPPPPRRRGGEMPEPISLYLHIPFCRRKCRYCNFYSVDAEEGTGLVERFLAALSREMALIAAERAGEQVATVYFGGGTPSLLTPDELDRLLADLGRHWTLGAEAEITLEANPGTLTAEGLKALRQIGVNRLSLGVQSFQDPVLRFLGRIHDRADAFRAVDLARAAGFDNLSLDLISAIPGETVARWEGDLAMAVALAPQHIAAYGLTIENRTPLGRQVAAGQLLPAAPEIEAAILERTMAILGGAGYDHYEVSNYSRPGFACRHNLAYWSHRDYLSFGPSAHSFRREDGWARARRWWNVPDLERYCSRLEENRLPLDSEESLGKRELLEERIFLGLRRGSLDLDALVVEFDCDLAAKRGGALQGAAEAGLAVLAGGVFRLTPSGFLLCDEIARRLLP